MNFDSLQHPNGAPELESTHSSTLKPENLSMDPTAHDDGPQSLNLTREGLLEKEVRSLSRKLAKLQAKSQDVAQLVSLYKQEQAGT